MRCGGDRKSCVGRGPHGTADCAGAGSEFFVEALANGAAGSSDDCRRQHAESGIVDGLGSLGGTRPVQGLHAARIAAGDGERVEAGAVVGGGVGSLRVRASGGLRQSEFAGAGDRIEVGVGGISCGASEREWWS